jgi:hypothetical protein
MSSIVEVDYLSQARSRYTQQFKNKPVFDAHIKIFIDEILELQDTFQDLIGLRSLETAVGAQLDMIGAIVGQPRALVDFSLFPFFGFDGASQAQTFGSLYDAALGGTWKSISDSEGASFEVDDDTYRFIIKARIVANISNTTPQGVIDAVNYIVGRTDSSIVEMGNAHLKIKHHATLTTLQEYFLRGLSSIGSIIPLPICVSYEIATLSTVVNYEFNGTDGDTTTTDSVGNTTASGLGVVSGSSFAYIFNNKLLARNNYTTIDDSGSLSPDLIFENDFEIEVAVYYDGWAYAYGETIWKLQNGSGMVMNLDAFKDGHIELSANPTALVGGGGLVSFPSGINLAAQQVIKVARVGSTISVYVDGILKGATSSTGTVNAGRINFWYTNFERFVDYLRIKKA